MNLTYEQNKRYSRQLVMKEIGESGQKKLLSSSVLVIGAGAIPEKYFVGRYGGDEFIALLNDVTQQDVEDIILPAMALRSFSDSCIFCWMASATSAFLWRKLSTSSRCV